MFERLDHARRLTANHIKIGPLGLAVVAGTSNVVTPRVTVAAIPPCFLFLAARLVLCGPTFALFGFETGRRTIGEIDQDFTPPPATGSLGLAAEGRK